jgi:antitoxin HigA-1
MAELISPVSPGQMLAEEFLNPIGMTKYRLAKSIGVPAQRIGDIIAGKRGITANTHLRLCKFFGLSDGWWLKLRAGYDTVMTKRDMAGSWTGLCHWSGRVEHRFESYECSCILMHEIAPPSNRC